VECYNHFVIETTSDTRPEIAALQRSLLRKASPARKLAMLGQMNLTVKTLALSGLRSRYPQDTPSMLRRRLADLLLGPELALLVYGSYVIKRG
jgi:hypothetical protein